MTHGFLLRGFIVLMSLTVALAMVPGLAFASDEPKVGEKAKDFELAALGGDKVKLSKLVESGPVVLIVLRGFPGYQCRLCTLQFGEFIGKAEKFKEKGARVVFVDPGSSENLEMRAEEFVKGKNYPAHVSILLDPDFTFTTAYGLRWNAKGETAYPSTFVINGEQRVLFAKVSRTHGDRSKADEVLKALAD